MIPDPEELVSVSVGEPSNVENELAILRDKYDRLTLQNQTLQRTNHELEDRLLMVVERTESDKLRLSEEIDDVSNRLRLASNNVTLLQAECARYKQDCVLAVHLLQCQPSAYVAQKKSTDSNSSDKKSKTKVPKMVTSPSYSTFPPTAIYYNQDQSSEDSQPEDPAHVENESAALAQSELSPADNLTQQFVDKIRAQDDYHVTELRQCPRCGLTVNTTETGVQTERIAARSSSSGAEFSDKRLSRCDSGTSCETAI